MWLQPARAAQGGLLAQDAPPLLGIEPRHVALHVWQRQHLHAANTLQALGMERI
jgi:hypothetical protein